MAQNGKSGYNQGMWNQTIAKPTILVVDDNAPFRHLVCAWLIQSGYKPVEATDGQDAINKLGNQPVDVILLDLQMEPLGGFNFKDAIRDTIFNTIPTVMITSDSSSDILIHATRLGISAVMKKPVDQVRLLRMIEQQLSRANKKFPARPEPVLQAKPQQADSLLVAEK